MFVVGFWRDRVSDKHIITLKQFAHSFYPSEFSSSGLVASRLAYANKKSKGVVDDPKTAAGHKRNEGVGVIQIKFVTSQL